MFLILVYFHSTKPFSLVRLLFSVAKLVNLKDFIYLLIYIFFGHVACGILVPLPGIEPRPAALEIQSPNHWAAREVPNLRDFKLHTENPSFAPTVPTRNSISNTSLYQEIYHDVIISSCEFKALIALMLITLGHLTSKLSDILLFK